MAHGSQIFLFHYSFCLSFLLPQYVLKKIEVEPTFKYQKPSLKNPSFEESEDPEPCLPM